MANILGQLLSYVKPAVSAYQQNATNDGSSVADQIESYALPILQQIKPSVVITAPDGQKLYIDVTPSADNASQSTLWPNGFGVSLATGNTPVASNVTQSPGDFFLSQSPTLLAAPGPLGITWLIWIGLLVSIIAFPFILHHLFKK